MRKISYRVIYNRKNQLNAQGTALLQVEAYLLGKKIYFSTHIYLKPDQWDKRRHIIINHPHSIQLNLMLKEFMLQLEQKEIELWKGGHEVTLALLKNECASSASSSFLHFVKDHIHASQAKESTKKNRLTTLLLLKRFRPGVTFKDVSTKFIFDFEQYLYKKGLQVNTVAKHMKHLKSFVNSAIDRGYLNDYDYAFRRYRIKTKEYKHSFLMPEELHRLEVLVFEERYRYLEHTLDAFLFCCYTGLRYSDFISLNENNVVKIEGKPWIRYRSVKTGTEVKLPLSLLFEGKAWKILRKYWYDLSGFFQLKSNSSINKELIRIRKLAGIQTHFSFHSARHTNATLLIYKGVNITTVQKLLGHRNISTTQGYSQVMERTLVKDLIKCSRSLKARVE